MAWNIEFAPSAVKELGKLDRQVARRITTYLREHIAPLENPRSVGHALSGSSLGEFWRYRVGDYRIICEIQDKVLRILVIKLGNRREVYR